MPLRRENPKRIMGEPTAAGDILNIGGRQKLGAAQMHDKMGLRRSR